MLADYDDKFVLDGLMYGFPLNFDGPDLANEIIENHSSALASSKELDDYVVTELKGGFIAGPYKNLPFKPHFNPS